MTENNRLRDYCSSDTEDRFVGLKYENGAPNVVFPYGYCFSEDNAQVRRDILRLFATLDRFGNRAEGADNRQIKGGNRTRFPVLSYQYLIHDYLTHGYYTEKEVEYKRAARGKINWKRTIQNIRPQIDGTDIVYTDFIVRTSKTDTNNLLTRIHEYCVYESFEKLGWLYLESGKMPPKPLIKLKKPLFLRTLKDAVSHTFNVDKKRLFTSMINVLCCCEENVDAKNNGIGVEKFEYVWQDMIDHVFGEDNKDEFSPHSTWHIGKTEYRNTPLQPDTIMRFEDKLFILDAKYYKYGITGDPFDLPGSSSIQKQITYGEYADVKKAAASGKIFNAFVLPFHAKEGEPYMKIADDIATADWKVYDENTPNYCYIAAVLLDTRHIVETYTRKDMAEIEKMSRLIEEAVVRCRKNCFSADTV